MSMQDTTSDMLVRIKNAQMMSHPKVSMPSSKFKLDVVKVLKEEGYVADFEESQEGVKKTLSIKLKYFNEKPVISMLKRISKPSLRIYKSVDELPEVQGGYGIAIISTSKGIMTEKQARQAGVGGEVVCIVA